jgi:hypothetical protein
MPKIAGWCIGCHKLKQVRVSRITRDPKGICSDCELRAQQQSKSQK